MSETRAFTQYISQEGLPPPRADEEVSFEMSVKEVKVREKTYWFVRALCSVDEGDAVIVGQWGPFLSIPQIHGIDFT